ncbi:E3 ubiquitin-protein ligase mycbp2 [Xenoophorus captivus]|uniref:E3 ubiquitin-protein ligase mycbp2 n=1 Tax=Xenoophorus captivus TaxID=1517983 RepID=A0ABV0QUP0_9TELE
MGSCPTLGTQSDCRTRYQLLLSGRALAERYRRIYTTAINDKEQGINQGRGFYSGCSGQFSCLHLLHPKKDPGLDKRMVLCYGALFVPDIKLHSNPSAFNVYCNVRHCVLDWQQKEASLALASRTSVQSGDSDSEEEEEYREPAIKLPKVETTSLVWWCHCLVSSQK